MGIKELAVAEEIIKSLFGVESISDSLCEDVIKVEHILEDFYGEKTGNSDHR